MTNIERIIKMDTSEVAELIDRMVATDGGNLEAWWCTNACGHRKECKKSGMCADDTKFTDIVTAFLESDMPLTETNKLYYRR